jgi:hypothetical protein
MAPGFRATPMGTPSAATPHAARSTPFLWRAALVVAWTCTHTGTTAATAGCLSARAPPSSPPLDRCRPGAPGLTSTSTAIVRPASFLLLALVLLLVLLVLVLGPWPRAASCRKRAFGALPCP